MSSRVRISPPAPFKSFSLLSMSMTDEIPEWKEKNVHGYRWLSIDEERLMVHEKENGWEVRYMQGKTLASILTLYSVLVKDKKILSENTYRDDNLSMLELKSKYFATLPEDIKQHLPESLITVDEST